MDLKGRLLIFMTLAAGALSLFAGGAGGCCSSGSRVTTPAHWELTGTTLSNMTITVTAPDGSDVPVALFSRPSAPLAATFDPAIGSLGFVLAADATTVDVFYCSPDFGPITESNIPDDLANSPFCKVAYLGLAPEPDACQGTGAHTRACTFTLEAQAFQVDTLICHFDEASSTQTCIGNNQPVYQVYYLITADTSEQFIPDQTQCL